MSFRFGKLYIRGKFSRVHELTDTLGCGFP